MKKAIVIGATSGIGKTLAELLASDGYTVGITGRRAELLSEIKRMNPESFISLPFDITDIKTTILSLENLERELGGLDLLILSSGTGELNQTLDFEIEKHTIDTNVSGFTNIADWTYRYFENQKYGHFVAISSVGGLRGNGTAPAYNASKSYQMNYLEGLRQKAYKLKVPVTITDVRPGLVNTDMAKGEGLFWVMPVEKIGNQIYSAIKKKKKIVYVSKRWGVIARILKVLPGFIYERL
jgi:short-subunit dehydrogenase